MAERPYGRPYGRVCEHCGHVTRDPEPTDTEFELQRASERIADLELENARLKARNRQLRAGGTDAEGGPSPHLEEETS